MKGYENFHTFRGYQILKQNNNDLTPSMEDYLEMIYRNCLEEGYVRINWLAEQLNVQAPSVTKVVQKLTKLEILNYERYGIIQLTDKGRIMGEFLLRRHKTIEKFLKNIGTENTLLRDTEMIEHNISMDTLQNMELFNIFLDDNPDAADKFIEFKQSYYKDQEKTNI